MTRDSIIGWKQLVKAHQSKDGLEQFSVARDQFLRHIPEDERITTLRRAVWEGRDIVTVLAIILNLSIGELQDLFPELVYLASWQEGGATTVRTAIGLLPKKWVLENIESLADIYLQKENNLETYRRFLELYHTLDKALTARLAARALAHNDEEIREAGEDFANL